jgi:prepilin-type N-terminal cleavage/methylation domain-containing protein
MTLRRTRGFTIMELLVVIAIIGILASVIFVAVGNARLKGRDSARLAAMKQIQSALNVYFNERGSYPVCSERWDGQSGCLYTALVPTYIKSLPVDPQYGGSGITTDYDYEYYSSGATYGMRTTLEGQPLDFTGGYPNGSTYCGVGPPTYPTCAWTQTCVYPGYSPDCNGQGYQLGSSL